MTSNPKWREIEDNLLPEQTASDRPDLVARVFRMKFKGMLTDVKDRHVLGKVRDHLTTTIGSGYRLDLYHRVAKEGVAPRSLSVHS